MINRDQFIHLIKVRVFYAVISVLAACAFAASHLHIVENPVQTRIVRVLVPAQKARNGEMTDAQCRSLKAGESRAQIEDQYGLPKGEEPTTEIALSLIDYKIKGTKRKCSLWFGYGEGKLTEVTLELPI